MGLSLKHYRTLVGYYYNKRLRQ